MPKLIPEQQLHIRIRFRKIKEMDA